MSERIVIIGLYVDETMRGGVQIWLDDARLQANALVSIEQAFRNRDIDRALITGAIDLSRGRGMADLMLAVKSGDTEMAELVPELGGVLTARGSAPSFRIQLVDQMSTDRGVLAS